MPIYEYRCSSCGHELEALQKLTEPMLTQCPACRREALVKQVSAAGFQLKGSGWYATDFKNGSKPAAKSPAKSDAKAEAKSESDGAAATSSESKGDSTSESTGSKSACGTNCACH